MLDEEPDQLSIEVGYRLSQALDVRLFEVIGLCPAKELLAEDRLQFAQRGLCQIARLRVGEVLVHGLLDSDGLFLLLWNGFGVVGRFDLVGKGSGRAPNWQFGGYGGDRCRSPFPRPTSGRSSASSSGRRPSSNA